MSAKSQFASWAGRVFMMLALVSGLNAAIAVAGQWTITAPMANAMLPSGTACGTSGNAAQDGGITFNVYAYGKNGTQYSTANGTSTNFLNSSWSATLPIPTGSTPPVWASAQNQYMIKLVPSSPGTGQFIKVSFTP